VIVMMSKVLVFLLLLSALPSAVLAEDTKPRHVQAGALMSLLKAPHPQIEGPALTRLGPDVPALLVEYATSTDQPVQVRLRALSWLQWFPTSQSRAVLQEMLRARDVDVRTIRICLRALAVAFGSEMLPLEREYLEHKDVQVREAAAYALGDIDDRRVRDVLVAHLDREHEIAVRDAIMGSLKRVAGREAKEASKGHSRH
jgi:HEAT repeat protein